MTDRAPLNSLADLFVQKAGEMMAQALEAEDAEDKASLNGAAAAFTVCSWMAREAGRVPEESGLRVVS